MFKSLETYFWSMYRVYTIDYNNIGHRTVYSILLSITCMQAKRYNVGSLLQYVHVVNIVFIEMHFKIVQINVSQSVVCDL